MVAALEMLFRPRRAIGAVAEAPRVGTGVITVVAVGIAVSALTLLADVIAGVDASVPTVLLAASSIPALVAFWLVTGWLVDAVARGLAGGSRRSLMLTVAAAVFASLVVYSLVTLLQAALIRAGASDSAIALAGLLHLAAIVWFVGLLAVGVRRVYGVTSFAALALALLPFAALFGALLVVALLSAAIHP